MLQVTFEVPEDTLLALKIAPDELAEELQLAAAVKLYELRRLSSGAAARLAGIPRTVFLMRLADYGVDTFDLTEEDLSQESRKMQYGQYRGPNMSTEEDFQLAEWHPTPGE